MFVGNQAKSTDTIMSTVDSIMAELKAKGSEQTRKTYARHGLPADRMFGVSVADLKIIAKKIKGQQQLAMDLYATGNLDAMYLAGMVADGAKMTRDQLQYWAEGAAGMPLIYDYSVPWVTIENAEARNLALEWIDSKQEHIAAAGWRTYIGLVTTKADSDLDLAEVEGLLQRVVSEIDGAENRAKQSMNSFVITVGSYVKPLLKQAKATANQLGIVTVDVGDTACKIPVATEYIAKMEANGKQGQKRKTIRC